MVTPAKSRTSHSQSAATPRCWPRLPTITRSFSGTWPSIGTFKFDEHEAPISAIAFNSADTLLASAAGSDPILIIDTATGRVVRTLKHDEGRITALALSPDGVIVAYNGADLTLKLWNSSTGETTTMRGSTGAFTCI